MTTQANKPPLSVYLFQGEHTSSSRLVGKGQPNYQGTPVARFTLDEIQKAPSCLDDATKTSTARIKRRLI
jgi:hypothetical protein